MSNFIKRAFLLLSLVLVGCGCKTLGTTSVTDLPKCDDAIATRAKQLEAQGFELEDFKVELTKDGVVLLAVLVNYRTGLIQVEATVDSEPSREHGLATGYEGTGRCQLGGREWYQLSKSIRADELPSKDT